MTSICSDRKARANHVDRPAIYLSKVAIAYQNPIKARARHDGQAQRMSQPVCGPLCSGISNSTMYARLSERDMAYGAPVDQVYLPGVDLNAALFDPRGYTYESLMSFGDMLSAGFQSFYTDVWLGPDGFQLCPGRMPTNTTGNFTTQTHKDQAMCNTNFNISSIFAAISSYISDTNTNLAVNLISVTVRPRLLLPNSTITSDSVSRQFDQDVLSQLRSAFAENTFTPSDLAVARNTPSSGTTAMNAPTKWPDLRYVLLSVRKRLIAFVDPSELPVALKRDTETFHLGSDGIQRPVPAALANLTAQLDAADLKNLSSHSFRTATLSDKTIQLGDWVTVVGSGYSPVLNASIDNQTMQGILNADWAWAPNAPVPQSYDDRAKLLRERELLFCATETGVGWNESDCNHHLSTLCRSRSNPYDWIVTEQTSSYFDYDCPDGFSSACPATPLEARYVRQLTAHNRTFWVDMNSLSLPDCWVTGGPSAACPYNIIQGGRNGVAVLCVAAAVSVLLMAIIIFLEWNFVRMPLRHRKVPKRRQVLPPAHSMEGEGIAS